MAFDPSPRRKPGDPPKPPTTQTDPSFTQLQSSGLTPDMFGPAGQMPAMPNPASVYGMAAPQPPPPDLSGMTGALGGIRGSADPMAGGPMAGAKSSGFGAQDAMMAAYLAATLGGTIGTLMKPLPPPPPIAVPQSSPNPITANAAMQSSLGLAQNRKQRTPHQFGKGG